MTGRLWHYAISDRVPRRSLLVALVVGTILNLINQGDALVSGAALDTTKLLLTYLVPYCVSTYGAVSYRLHAQRNAAGGPPPPFQRPAQRSTTR
jgi:hypothetical protein